MSNWANNDGVRAMTKRAKNMLSKVHSLFYVRRKILCCNKCAFHALESAAVSEGKNSESSKMKSFWKYIGQFWNCAIKSTNVLQLRDKTLWRYLQKNRPKSYRLSLESLHYIQKLFLTLRTAWFRSGSLSFQLHAFCSHTSYSFFIVPFLILLELISFFFPGEQSKCS